MQEQQKTAKKKIIKSFSFLAFLCIIIVVIVLAILNWLDLLSYDTIMTSLSLKNKPAVNSDFSVHFIDVGQGDCELIISGGKVALIDGGDVETAKKVVSYLKAQNISRIDYLIATHPHSDHIGGLADVVDSFNVGQVFMSKPSDGLIPTTLCYEKLLNSINNKGLKISQPIFNEVLYLGEATLNLFPPQKDYADLNNYSIISKLKYKNISFLFSGDAQKAEELDLISQGVDIKADVLKVGHHGSATSSDNAFLQKVGPQICVISCGAGNSFNHPSSETIKRLNEYTKNVFRTDLLGTIVFSSDGNSLEYFYRKGD